MNVFFLAFVSLLSFFFNISEKKEERISDIFTSITSKTGDQIARKYPYVNFCGIGGAINHDDGSVKFERLAFQLQKKVNKDEALILLLTVIDDYIRNVYSNSRLEKYLEMHPFTYKNLYLTFFIRDETNGSVYHPDISRVSFYGGNIEYTTLNEDEEGIPIIINREEEPYEKAIKRINHKPYSWVSVQPPPPQCQRT